MNFLIFLALVSQAAEQKEAPSPSPAVAPSKEVPKEIVYQKVTNMDLNGSKVEGEKGLPQEFFLYNVKTPQIRSFLEDRLKFSFRNYNELAN
jgi:hypothetical protein